MLTTYSCCRADGLTNKNELAKQDALPSEKLYFFKTKLIVHAFASNK
jgi:hypothetical protein